MDETPPYRVRLTPEQRQRLVAAIKEQYRGVRSGPEPMILDGYMLTVRRWMTFEGGGGI